MPRLEWDKIGERKYETGVDRGVLYPMVSGAYGDGVAWNGLTGVTMSPSGAEPTPLFADNIKYLTLMSAEENGGTIEAYMYPDEFKACNGEATVAAGVTIGQQKRSVFGFCYRTLIGNDTDGTAHGYKLHLVYGAVVSPSEKAYTTVNDSPEAITFSWEFTTTPVMVTDHDATSEIVIDSTTADPTKLAALEDMLYGKNGTGTSGDNGVAPRLPLPDEVIALMQKAA